MLEAREAREVEAATAARQGMLSCAGSCELAGDASRGCFVRSRRADRRPDGCRILPAAPHPPAACALARGPPVRGPCMCARLQPPRPHRHIAHVRQAAVCALHGHSPHIESWRDTASRAESKKITPWPGRAPRRATAGEPRGRPTRPSAHTRCASPGVPSGMRRCREPHSPCRGSRSLRSAGRARAHVNLAGRPTHARRV